ncbi:MAG: hypothetical protein HYZ00_14065, partial [Candidatus Hydrogenedentes bacterium]|nr:hypothetical protein [Candidatus Hydrogenedentota bacterium]
RAWYFRFNNGFELWARIAGPRGINFQGMHTDWQIIDEAQELTETAWQELFQALNGTGRRWVYGVPNGLRNTFFRMTTDQTAEQYNWPSALNPEYTPEKDAELARLYGGRTTPGYVHRVLGQHGEPMHAVFSLEDYLACVNPDLPFTDRVLHEDDPINFPRKVEKGEYYLGCDLGYAKDPSEFVIYRHHAPDLTNILRLRLEGVNYKRQQSVIEALNAAYHFRGIGIDAGNNGNMMAHALKEISLAWCDKVHAYEFGGMIDLAPLPDGAVPRRHRKEFMTELLQRRLTEHTIIFPPIPDREAQYAAHTYHVNEAGRILYEKGNDHIIDADRCALLRLHEDLNDLASPQQPLPTLLADLP